MRKIREITILIIGVILLFFSCSNSHESEAQRKDKRDRKFGSNGEQIYFTGTNMNGTAISSEGLMQSEPVACASCHGPDGKGRMMGTLKSTDIRFKTLTAKKHAHGEQGPESHVHERKHPPYDDETLKRAITQGMDPAGNKLNPIMPKWRMSEEYLIDLISFLKTLE